MFSHTVYPDRRGQSEIGPAVITQRCHYCSKGRSPREMLHLGAGGIRMCWYCWEKHREAVHVLSTSQPPKACQRCAILFEDLPADSNGSTTMALVFKDGIYQILCNPCADVYIEKRRDLYADTQFGWNRKLK